MTALPRNGERFPAPSIVASMFEVFTNSLNIGKTIPCELLDPNPRTKYIIISQYLFITMLLIRMQLGMIVVNAHINRTIFLLLSNFAIIGSIGEPTTMDIDKDIWIKAASLSLKPIAHKYLVPQ